MRRVAHTGVQPPPGAVPEEAARSWPTKLASRWEAAALAVALLVVFGISGGLEAYHTYVLGLLCVYVIVTVGLAILFAEAGLLSVGQAGFVAIGAYATSLLLIHAEMSIWLAVTLGGCIAAAVGVAVGIPALRLNPLYIAAVTFGFGEIVRITATQWTDVTNGGDGLALPLFDPAEFVPALVLVTGGLVAVAYVILRSRLGRAMRAVRDSEIAARALGVRTSRVKTLAFAISAFYAGVGGGFFALLTSHVSPDSFTLEQSLFFLTAVIVGGLGTLAGPVIAAIGLGVLQEATQSAGLYRELIAGVILLGALLVMKSGIAGVWATVKSWGRRAAARRAA
jgi:branched-chain amino acid transport system permease protein